MSARIVFALFRILIEFDVLCFVLQVILDVQQFSPEEITVKTVSNNIIIEAKHEERQDEHGYVSRQFLRRYVLPPSHDVNNITSSLSSDGVLTITAPKKVSNEKEKQRWPDESEDSSVAVDQPILSRLLLFFLLFCLFLFLDLFIFVFLAYDFFNSNHPVLPLW